MTVVSQKGWTMTAMTTTVTLLVCSWGMGVLAFQPMTPVASRTRSFSTLPLLMPKYTGMRNERLSYMSSLRANAQSALATSNDDEPWIEEGTQKQIVSAGAFCLIDIAMRTLFLRYDLAFPSSLAGCGAVLAALLLANKEQAKSMFDFLDPGAQLLTRWLPVFFVPSLVILPLTTAQMGSTSAAELLKVSIVVVGGFMFSLLSTAWTVTSVRRWRREGDGGDDTTSDDKRVQEFKDGVEEIGDAARDAMKTAIDATEDFAERREIDEKPYKKKTMQAWAAVAAVGAAAGFVPVLASKPRFEVPFRTAFMLGTTLSTYVFGARLPKKYTKVVHPLVTCTALTWAVATAYASAIGTSLRSMLRQYRAAATTMGQLGAGDILLWLLGPAVVSLAISMYDKRKEVRENLPEVATSVGVATAGGLFGTAFLTRLLSIGDPVLRLALLSRNITSPLAIAIASMLGADASLAVALVVITGIIGANFGASIFDQMDVKDKIARGLGMGAAAHGLGTAALEDDKKSFTFAAIAMALTASAATILVAIPPVQRALITLALG